MKKTNKYLLVELITIFLLTLLYNLMHTQVTYDEIWNYGYAYKISQGLIPYKDFNMIVTPLYPFLGSIFLRIFGKNLLVYHIFNAIICTTIFYLIKKLVPRGYYIIYFLFLFTWLLLPNYSFFCLFLLYLLMFMEDKKANDYLVGIVLALTFLTKQNIGIMLCIPTLFTKDIKKIVKRIIGFFIPSIIFLFYLLYTNTLYQFIDYCFLGISDFAQKNMVISYWIIIMTIAIIYLIYKYIKTKDIKALYILFFQILAFPLFDAYHILLAFLPVLGYFLSSLKLVVNTARIAFTYLISIIFVYNIIDIMNNKIIYPNETHLYKYRYLYKNNIDSIKETSKYIKKNEDHIFIITDSAYLLKLEANVPINKFDLLNDGNLGKNGWIKIINEIDKFCSNNECLFLLIKEEINTDTLSQTNRYIINYVANNYKEIDKVSAFTIYGNGDKYE